MAEQRYCPRCNKTLNEKEFYKSNNKEKYPEGYMELCKKCMTAHVDNWDSDTYLWILQEADVPWVPDEWNKLMIKYTNEGKTITNMTIIGRYLAKMQLKQFKDFRWKDTQFLQDMANNKIKETMERQGYDASQIADAVNKASFAVPDKPLEEPEPVVADAPAPANDDYFGPDNDDDLELTEEDRTYLRLKWGKMYRPEEWVRLEQLYNEMMESYDIQSAGHVDTLKLLCKTSLKCNQLIDIGDVEGYQKMSKVYDQLMKSGKFQAAQNKSESGEFIDSIGELVTICETEAFIPRFYIEKPNDKVDACLADMKSYTHTLVTEEVNLGNMIEAAVKAMVKEDTQEEDEDLEDEIMSMEEVEALKDQDFSDFSDFQDEEAAEDALMTALESNN